MTSLVSDVEDFDVWYLRCEDGARGVVVSHLCPIGCSSSYSGDKITLNHLDTSFHENTPWECKNECSRR